MDGIFDFFTTKKPESETVTNDPGMIDRFKARARAWARDVLELFETDVAGSPELEAEKMRLMKWAKYIKTGVEAIFGTLDDLKSVNMGILPLIPVAAILASGAAITKWLTDYAKFKEKIALHDKLVSSGATPADASRVVDKLTGEKPLLNLGTNPLILGGVGLGLMWFLNTHKKGK